MTFISIWGDSFFLTAIYRSLFVGWGCSLPNGLHLVLRFLFIASSYVTYLQFIRLDGWVINQHAALSVKWPGCLLGSGGCGEGPVTHGLLSSGFYLWRWLSLLKTCRGSICDSCFDIGHPWNVSTQLNGISAVPLRCEERGSWVAHVSFSLLTPQCYFQLKIKEKRTSPCPM